MRDVFKRQLTESGYIHHLLKPDLKKSTEARLLRKKVERSRSLWDGADIDAWQKDGTGQVSVCDGKLHMSAPARLEPERVMDHYVGFCHLRAKLEFNGEDLREYNRLSVRVKPLCDGFHNPFLTLSFRNDGEEKIPDVYYREGYHVLNLKNNTWNECVWEFPELPRDRITGFAVSVSCHGKELCGGDNFVFELCDFLLERVENPDKSLGWQGNGDTVSFSTTGYWTFGEKKAVVSAEIGETTFSLIEETSGKTVYSGVIEPLENEKGAFGVINFSSFATPGRYKLRIGENTSESFAVDNHVMEEAVWKAVNFIYAERCGYPVSGGHSFCHGDIIAEHNGLRLSYAGGWHDAGDVSQQTLQTAEVAQALFELAERVKGDTPLYRRLIEEARWGLDFVLRSRFGDGYRASSVGNTRWTNTFFGDGDDEPVRIQNRSFDNFLISGVEAFAGDMLTCDDPELAWASLNAAREDYGFALDRFNEVGPETRHMMEHTHNASLSLYYAAACWASARIFSAGGGDFYANEAKRFGDMLLACQDRGEAGLSFTGFFYRDEEKKTIVHFNHQAREHLFVMALESLCAVLPDAPSRKPYEDGLRRYGEYIKAMYTFSAPYGMIPAGVHAFGEENDAETFALLHLMTTHENDKDNYRAQLEGGVRLNDSYSVKQFPVWFSFRGNAAVQLSSAKAASAIGRLFNDEALMEIARDQLYWMAGKNPFGQSMMYGEGSNYAQQYAALAGETVGEMPVGIQTRGNGDSPYWPMANFATYKEIWMSTVGHWLRTVADLY